MVSWEQTSKLRAYEAVPQTTRPGISDKKGQKKKIHRFIKKYMKHIHE